MSHRKSRSSGLAAMMDLKTPLDDCLVFPRQDRERAGAFPQLSSPDNPCKMCERIQRSSRMERRTFAALRPRQPNETPRPPGNPLRPIGGRAHPPSFHEDGTPRSLKPQQVGNLPHDNSPAGTNLEPRSFVTLAFSLRQAGANRWRVPSRKSEHINDCSARVSSRDAL